jgi:hypothetical protein
MNWIVRFGLLLAITTSVSLVRAQAVSLNRRNMEEEKDLEVLQAWKLTLTPAAEPRPALKYSLHTRYWDRTPGNATPSYYRVLLMQESLADSVVQDYAEHSERWLANNLDDATKDEMRIWLKSYVTVLQELRVATFRERIDLDLRLRDLRGLQTIQFLLPDAQATRQVARMLQVKARLEIEEGRLDEAIETLQMGYRLAEFAAKTPTLINDLVGVAIGSIMTSELTRLVAHPDAPNMYWAIASLPRPLIDLREALEWESGVPQQIFPFLQDAETAQYSPGEWRRLVMDAYMQLHELTGDYAGKPGRLGEVAATALIMKIYPIAKQRLIADGTPRDEVEAMPVGRVVAIHTAKTHRYVYDEMFKWTFLSYEKAHDKWPETMARLRDNHYFGPEGANKDLLPIANILLPAIQHAWYAPIRLERQLAALRVVEAIRMHATTNGGQLPKSLDDIKVIVVPNDPLYGKPFDYKVDGDTAVIETPPRPGMGRRQETYQYTLQIKK